MSVVIKPVINTNMVTRQTHGKIMKRLMLELMMFHIKYVLPLHFQEGAEHVYHYFRRTTKYLKAKQIKHGHQKPNVWSGKTEEEMKAKSPADVAHTQWKARLRHRFHWQRGGSRGGSRGAKDGNQTPGAKGSGTFQRKLEMEKVLKREVRDKSAYLARRYVEECNNPANKRKRRPRR